MIPDRWPMNETFCNVITWHAMSSNHGYAERGTEHIPYMDCLLFLDILTSSTSIANNTAENPATQLYAILGNIMDTNVLMTSCTTAQNILNTINMLSRYIDPSFCSTELPTELRKMTLNIKCTQLVWNKVYENNL